MQIIAAIIIFSLLVFVHELGHFLMAKLFDVKVLEFAIGMGPAIFKKQKGETLYSVRSLPLGGFCKMLGEDETVEDERSFSAKVPYKRMLILAMGSIFNILLGFLIFFVILSFQKEVAIPEIEYFSENSAAQQAGFLEHDRIIKMDGQSVNIYADIQLVLSQTKAKNIEIEVMRNGAAVKKDIAPIYDEVTDSYKMGFVAKTTPNTPGLVLKNSVYNTIFVVKYVYVSLKGLITREVPLNQVSGPVGVVREIGKAVKDGLFNVLSFAAIIAINLGIMNLLPIPALDGGRIFFVFVELIRRKPIKPDQEGIVHFVGIVLLMLVMIAATWSDISKWITEVLQ